MITPTPGRIVWFHPASQTAPQPQAAIVTYVWSDTMVNLCVFDMHGIPRAEQSVVLLQDGGLSSSQGLSRWCEWMPYQKGQATKTEALEAKLAK